MINLFYNKNRMRRRVLIFKTNIKTKKNVNTLKSFFNSQSSIIKWTVDIEDIDNVLRIEATNNLSESHLINQIKTLGFYCDELTD